MAVVIDGNKLAADLEAELLPQVQVLQDQGKFIKISAIVFKEDAGSLLYTRLKAEAAARLGIGYQVHYHSLSEDDEVINSRVREAMADETVTGCIIQKPGRATLLSERGEEQNYAEWWHGLTTQLTSQKDVDGLHPAVIETLAAGLQPKVLPATVAAIDRILAELSVQLPEVPLEPMLVLGRSDIVGLPLYWLLKQRTAQVENWGRAELSAWRQDNPDQPLPFQTVISATGAPHLLSVDDLVEEGVAIDVGEPRPDINPAGLRDHLACLSPAPGGVGPLTVACLMENAVKLMVQSAP
jgi:methylenetetrahydrofolate dehydrogenase (NADP+)/methenyltetrahydrofolate cyclohydrolase